MDRRDGCVASTPPEHDRIPVTEPNPADDLIAARRQKLRFLREELGVDPYGGRVDGISSLRDAREAFDESAHEALEADPESEDRRPRRLVSGRVMQHRDMGKLVFMTLRDHTGDLQVSVSKAQCDPAIFRLSKKLDYGDVVVAGGPMGRTRKGETCVWADRVEIHAKSLTPPPEKWHGLSDPEIRFRRRYVDLHANPEAIVALQDRARIVSRMRSFMERRDFLEVETPMMQPMAGGAAARPFVTHHNTLDLDLFLRIAPELYLKRLLVGGLPRVFEINRNFRNEGVDRSHNPEFTALEVYEAFGDCWSMLELTESMLHELAVASAEDRRKRGDESVGGTPDGPVLPFDDIPIDWSRPFVRVTYSELFERATGFDLRDEAAVRAKAASLGIEDSASRDRWLLVDEIFEREAEALIDPARPTFVTGYPSAVSPLTRPMADDPELCERWDIFVAGMEVGPAYTELNDPEIQLAKFTEQLSGADDEADAFRTLDDDFLTALRVGMPPAGGLGIGVDRVVMLLTGMRTIREVIAFPLMRPEGGTE
ncbi:MAG: lysine--tRNA ligase [Phycisphaera sp.]|nr:lysine--tRNA ligase [Phycisphaera sp.]